MNELTPDEAKDALAALNAVNDQLDAAFRDNLMRASVTDLIREARALGLEVFGLGKPDLVRAIMARIEELAERDARR